MRALVTGANGFCGRHLVHRLRAQAIDVAAIDLEPEPTPSIHSRYIQADVRAPSFEAAVRDYQPDWLFHLAGRGASADTASIYETNVAGTVRVLQVVKQVAPGCRVLLVGSFAEYGPVAPELLPVTEDTPCSPVGAYGISKLAATLLGLELGRTLGVAVAVARPSNVVGAGIPASLFVGALLLRAKEALRSSEPVVQVGDIDAERDYVAVDDVVDAYIRILQARLTGIFNVCSGSPVRVWDLARRMLDHSPRPIAAVVDPTMTPSSTRRIVGDSRKAHDAFGFRAAPIDRALEAAWNHVFREESCG